MAGLDARLLLIESRMFVLASLSKSCRTDLPSWKTGGVDLATRPHLRCRRTTEISRRARVCAGDLPRPGERSNSPSSRPKNGTRCDRHARGRCDDYLYGPNSEPVEQVNLSSSTPTYLTYTPSDSSWLATNNAGQQVAFWRYDAFGNLATGTPDSPFGYSGQYTDASTGLVNDRARFYESQTGSFTTRDPAFAATDQAYAYASQDPVNQGDPSGQSRSVDEEQGWNVPYISDQDFTFGITIPHMDEADLEAIVLTADPNPLDALLTEVCGVNGVGCQSHWESLANPDHGFLLPLDSDTNHGPTFDYEIQSSVVSISDVLPEKNEPVPEVPEPDNGTYLPPINPNDGEGDGDGDGIDGEAYYSPCGTGAGNTILTSTGSLPSFGGDVGYSLGLRWSGGYSSYKSPSLHQPGASP